jgi:hypothetical protein
MELEADLPFAQRFNYQLRDVTVRTRVEDLRYDGVLKIHTPALERIEVQFRKKETVSRLRADIQEALPEYCVDDFNIVTRHGVVAHGTLDEYHVEANEDVILVRKGYGKIDELARRRFWLASRRSRSQGRSLSVGRKTPTKRHRITKYGPNPPPDGLPLFMV